MLPDRLGPYRIVRKVGRGGMGTVYMGIDDLSGQTAAVKLLSAAMAQQSDFRDRFKAEIEALCKLNHPNIVRIFGFGEDGEQIFYAMEYVAGSSLEEQIGRGRTFPWREVVSFGVVVARALRHAHDRGVIHRDIKPGNLLLADAGPLKLSDFGIARFFGNVRLTGAGSVLGTAEFMSPEQADGRPVDPRSDLYSLGGVLYVLLAGRPLYDARSFAEMLDKQRFEKPAPLGQFARDIPAELGQIVHRLLEKDPQHRFSTATALERRLETILESFALPPPDGPGARINAPPAPASPRPVGQFAPTIAATQARDVADAAMAPPPPPAESPEAGGGEAGNGPANAGKESPPAASRFVPVRPGELDRPPPIRPATRWISWQTGALVVALITVWLLALYMLRPPTADALYRRIQRQAEGGSADALEQADGEIQQFLARFPHDARYGNVKDFSEKIELTRLERRLDLQAKGVNVRAPLSPVERCYIDALNTARIDPEAGIAKLQAMIDLFASPQDVSGPRGRCIQLAKRRLGEIRPQYAAQSQEQRTLVAERIGRADELQKTDTPRARAMYRAIIVLYQNRDWAKDLVQRARAALEKEAAAGGGKK